eukprot:3325683-Amphidinium_carterae.1
MTCCAQEWYPLAFLRAVHSQFVQLRGNGEGDYSLAVTRSLREDQEGYSLLAVLVCVCAA